MAAVRYTWMFRTAAALFLFFGGVWLWRFGFTDYQPEQRPYGLAAGCLSLLVGVFLLRRARAGNRRFGRRATAVVGISAAVFAPECARAGDPVSRGAGHRLLLYAVFAVRALRSPRNAEATMIKR